jgi:hypothetical protein
VTEEQWLASTDLTRMNEAAWLAHDKPHPMLLFLRRRASGRRLRLFACTGCRRVWHALGDERSRAAVEASERYSDGLVGYRDLREAKEAATAAWQAVSRERGRPLAHATPAMRAAVQAVFAAHREAWHAAWGVADELQGGHPAVIRDFFGNPFRPSLPLAATILAWGDRTVPRLAQAIYDDRKLPEGTLDTARLAILADALLDAGLEDEELLPHLHSEGPHYRGCWAVDLLLGKS